MSNIAELKNKLRLILGSPEDTSPQVITPFIWGKPGIGKSQSVRQIADEMGIGFIDLRLSQLESADLRGIPVPDIENNISRWIPPEFLPFEGVKKFEGTSGILLLDELNRARPDVLQAAFQLVLDRQVGMNKILDSWNIVAAGNLGDEDRTDVVEMDSALKNRFIHFHVDVDLSTWVDWATSIGIQDDILNFVQGKPQWLYTIEKQDEGIFITPRSWEKFSDILKKNKNVDPKEITYLLGGDIIYSAAAHFIKYLESKEIISAKDVINKYNTLKKKINAMSRDQVYALSTELVDEILKIKNVKKNQVENVYNFTKGNLEKDNYIAFMKKLAKKCMDENHNFIDEYLETYEEESKNIISIFKNNFGD